MIRWFKGYFISSTYAKDISNQSWQTNLDSPCRKAHPQNKNINFARRTIYFFTSAYRLITQSYNFACMNSMSCFCCLATNLIVFSNSSMSDVASFSLTRDIADLSIDLSRSKVAVLLEVSSTVKKVLFGKKTAFLLECPEWKSKIFPIIRKNICFTNFVE